MASTASAAGTAAQQVANSAHTTAASAYYAHTYQQGYPQQAYPYQAWQGTAYEQAVSYAPAADTSVPPPPATEALAAPSSSTAQQAQTQAQQQYSADYQAYWQHHNAYHHQQQQQQQQQYQPYGHYTPTYYPGHGYGPPAVAPAQPQANASAWPPAAAREHQAMQHPSAAAPTPAQPSNMPAHTNGTYHTAPAATAPQPQAGYMAMPNGKFKPVPKADAEQTKPIVIKPNYTKQAKRKFSATAPGAPAKPVYVKVEEQAKKVKAVAQAGNEVDGTPASLKRLVEKCFNHPVWRKADTAQREHLEEVLKGIINDATSKKEMWTRDWENMPVPGSSAAPLNSTAPTGRQPVANSKWAVPVKNPVQAKPIQRQQQQYQQAPSASPAHSPSSRSSDSDRSYTYSRSRSRSPYSRSRSSSRSLSPVSSYCSPQSARRGGRGKAQASPADWQGRKPKRAGPPEPLTKKQRKAERRANWEAKQKAKSDAQTNKPPAIYDAAADDGPTPEELRRREMRSGRFARGAPDQSGRANVPVYAAELRNSGAASLAEADLSGNYHVEQGTCRNLEKKYFRLTGPPDPTTVRPPAVLRAALKRVVQRYRAGQCDMHYTEDQLKAMRQDATVQSLRGKLPVQIYEAHARACLEHGDSGGFNQCQTVLKVLYEEGSQGCVGEFVAYRVLYQSVFRKRESASLLQEMEHLTPQVTAHPAVAHALKVRKALVFARYTAFFQLYAAAPNLGRALMDTCLAKVRFAALETIVEGCRAAKVKVHNLASMLGFLVEPQRLAQLETAAHEQSSEVDLDGSNSMVLPGCRQTSYSGQYAAEGNADSAARATYTWLLKCNAVVLLQGDSPSDAVLDCKACTSLKKPDEASLVSHGDVTLNVESFMHHVAMN